MTNCKFSKDRQALKFAAWIAGKPWPKTCPKASPSTRSISTAKNLSCGAPSPPTTRTDVLNFNEELRHVPNPNKPDEPLFSESARPHEHQSATRRNGGLTASSRRPAVNNFLNQLNLTAQERRIVVIIFLVVIVVLNCCSSGRISASGAASTSSSRHAPDRSVIQPRHQAGFEPDQRLEKKWSANWPGRKAAA
jgi:hypothetical protein